MRGYTATKTRRRSRRIFRQDRRTLRRGIPWSWDETTPKVWPRGDAMRWAP
jgi:hypothetical protein